eukprot:Hpha_TRINITY_DN12600_c0_g1::TRINITY_DN12600_c0_g1_i1::g.49847::m.49847
MIRVRVLLVLSVVEQAVWGCTVISVSSGSTHTCGLMSTGGVAKYALKCWGTNTNGELGMGDMTPRGEFPATMGAALPFVGGASNTEANTYLGGSSYGCAFDTTSTSKGVFCWGLNSNGKLGVGDSADRGNNMGLGALDSAYLLPAVPIPGCVVVQLAVYSAHSCVLCNDMISILCWGIGTNGRLGSGDTSHRGGSPTFKTDPWPAVDLGGVLVDKLVYGPLAQHTCVILSGDTLKCWGKADRGQLGMGITHDVGDSPTEMGANLVSLLTSGQFAASGCLGMEFSCVVWTVGEVSCWGDNAFGQNGNGQATAYTMEPSSTNVQIDNAMGGPGKVGSLACGGEHVCALSNDGMRLACWGRNDYGQLGYGDTTNRGRAYMDMVNLPQIDLGHNEKITSISAGQQHTCASLENKGIVCWGRGSAGRLGSGSSNVGNTGGSALSLSVVDLDCQPSPTFSPSLPTTATPSGSPMPPTVSPTTSPSTSPNAAPTASPAFLPTESPTGVPTISPNVIPTTPPNKPPTVSPNLLPTPYPISPSTFPPTIPSPSTSPNSPVPGAPPPSRSPSAAPIPPPSSPPSTGPPPPPHTNITPVSPSPTQAPESADDMYLVTDSPSLSLSYAMARGAAEGAMGAAGSTMAAVVGGVANAGQGHLVLALDVNCEAAGIPRVLNTGLHPTHLNPFENEYVGCIIGAITVVGGAYLVGMGLAALGYVKHPNTALAAFILLYPGFCLSAMRLLMDSSARSSSTHAVLGGAVGLILGIIPMYMVHAARRSLPAAARVRPWDPPLPVPVARWVLFGDGDWVNCTPSHDWLAKWQSAVRHLSQPEAASGIAVEMGTVWLFSVVAGPATPTWTSCGVVRLLAGGLSLAKLVYVARSRPYRRSRDTLILALAGATITCALFLNAFAFFFHNRPFEAADWLLVGATLLMVIKGVLDVVAEVVLALRGYRKRAQDGELERGCIQRIHGTHDFSDDQSLSKTLTGSTLFPELGVGGTNLYAAREKKKLGPVSPRPSVPRHHATGAGAAPGKGLETTVPQDLQPLFMGTEPLSGICSIGSRSLDSPTCGKGLNLSPMVHRSSPSSFVRRRQPAGSFTSQGFAATRSNPAAGSSSAGAEPTTPLRKVSRRSSSGGTASLGRKDSTSSLLLVRPRFPRPRGAGSFVSDTAVTSTFSGGADRPQATLLLQKGTAGREMSESMRSAGPPKQLSSPLLRGEAAAGREMSESMRSAGPPKQLSSPLLRG